MKYECLNPVHLSQGNKEVGYVCRTVPCGKCANCLKRRRLQWIPRLLTEFHHSTDCYFVTLTYDDEHLVFDENGKWCFDKKSVQDYLKRLRYYCAEPFRYYLCAEYGKKSGRPHYHVCFFNFKVKAEFRDYFNLFVNVNPWRFGSVDVHPLTGRLITYSTKYILEYIQRDTTYMKPFILCSKGLGSQVLNDEQRISFIRKTAFSTGRFFYNVRGMNYPLPRYLRNKIFSKLERFKFDFDYRHRSLTTEEAEEMQRNQSFLDKHHITKDFEVYSANHSLFNISKQGKI